MGTLDLAELVPRRQLELALDRAEQLRVFDLVALRAVVRRNPGRVGAARLSVVLDSHQAGGTLTESEPGAIAEQLQALLG